VSELQARTMKDLRERGYLCGSVERRKRFPAKGKPPCRACGHVQMVDIASDLWNVFDLIAVSPLGLTKSSRPFGEILFVQVTDLTSHSKRREKIVTSAEAKLCMLSGARILIQSWKKRDNRWQATDEWLGLDQFDRDLPNTPADLYELQRKEKLPALPPGSTLPLSPMLKDENLPF
jgi:hypothetical protein